jgi:hypothetical protein
MTNRANYFRERCGVAPATRMKGADPRRTTLWGGTDMKKTAIHLAFLCFIAVSYAQVAATQQVAKIAGKWDVTVKMPDKVVSEQWNIQQDSGKITGTVKRAGGELPLTGEVTATSFRADVKDGDMQYKVLAAVDNDTMDETVRMGKNEYLWSAKRVK